MKLFKSISCGLLSTLLLLGTVAPFTFTACDNEHPEINISLSSDLGGIVQAINDANNSLTMKLALIEAAIQEGNLQNKQAYDLIVKAIETLSGTLDQKLDAIMAAISSQTASLETKLALIEAAIKAGLTDSKTDLTLIQQALETLNGTLEDKLAAIEAAIASQTTSLETKLKLIETALTAGFADEKTALGEIKTALVSLKGSVDGIDAAIDDVVAAIDKVVAAIGETNTTLKDDVVTALTDILAAINGLSDYSDILAAIKVAIEDLAETANPGLIHLVPQEKVIIPWDYKYYDNIKDTLIAKVHVGSKRDKLVPVNASKTRNVVSGKDYTEGTGAVTKHTNDSQAVDIVLVSAAEYGVVDSTYVYSIQKYDAADDIKYVGEFTYVVKSRPADAVLELGLISKPVLTGSKTNIDLQAIQAVYDYHKSSYKGYTFGTMAADFAGSVTIDSIKVTVDGASSSNVATCNFGYTSGGEATKLSLLLDKAGTWKVTIKTHFANVGYTFVVTIQVA